MDRPAVRRIFGFGVITTKSVPQLLPGSGHGELCCPMLWSVQLRSANTTTPVGVPTYTFALAIIGVMNLLPTNWS